MFRRTIVATLAAMTLLTTLSFAQQRGSKLTADDYIEIQQLYARYNNAIDSGDAEGYAATFVPDGVFNTFTGHDALVGFIHAWRDRMGGANRRHWNTNLTITPAADGASGSVYLLLVDVGQRPPVIQAAAKYEDQLVKTSDGWRFKKRVTHNEGPAAAPAGATEKK
ncbi:MAG TPA: nuclear transport factor 2 family protein [Bryobacteraceae bacterium]|nr:nuclear transport factor 2 family protein [Bryobacteraceae bacterium]